MISSNQIKDVLRYLELGYTEKQIKDITGVSKGSIYRIKKGIKTEELKQCKDKFIGSMRFENKEDIELFRNSKFGKAFDKSMSEKIDKLILENKELREKLKILQNRNKNKKLKKIFNFL